MKNKISKIPVDDAKESSQYLYHEWTEYVCQLSKKKSRSKKYGEKKNAVNYVWRQLHPVWIKNVPNCIFFAITCEKKLKA